MKKWICLLCCLLLFALPALAETDYTGEWYLNEIRYGELTAAPSMVGYDDFTLTLNEDGTASLVSVSSDSESASDIGAWVLNDAGILFVRDDSTLQFTVDESGNLVCDISEDGDTVTTAMVFGREKVVTEMYVPAAQKEVSDISEFNGTWTIHSVDLFGTMVYASTYNFSETITLQDGHMILTSDMFTTDITLEADGIFLDGVLTFNFTVDEEEYQMQLTLLEDGNLRDYEGSDEDLGALYYYFGKVE